MAVVILCVTHAGSTLETQASMKSGRFKRGLTDNGSTLGSM
jgi:hypothetical protein